MFRTTNELSSVDSCFFYVTIPTLLYPGSGPEKLTQKRHSGGVTYFFITFFFVSFSKFGLVFNLMVHLGAYNKSQ